MADVDIARYGAWRSPITAKSIAYGGVGLSEPRVDGETIYWIESRPAEGGRSVVVTRDPDGTARDAIPAEYNARTRIHEYGGAAYAVSDGLLLFSNFSDNHVYRMDGGQAVPLTGNDRMRYGDFCFDRGRNRVICVREDHTGDGEAVNTLVALSLTGVSDGEALVSGNDFYAYPRLNADSTRLAYITWHHPDMPWDGTELWVADVNADGSLGEARQVAGGLQESVLQPEWTHDGTLYFLSDRTEWWNVYSLTTGGEPEAVTSFDAEIGGPLWTFGLRWYTVAANGSLFCALDRATTHELVSVDPRSRNATPLPLPYSEIRNPAACGNNVVAVFASPTEEDFLGLVDTSTLDVDVLARSSKDEIDRAYLSVPRQIEFPTTNAATAYGWFYPPRNEQFRAPEGELPPLLVMSHGGPTGERGPTLNASIQFWTSRGIAVLDVNYRGSSGFGRLYREALNDNWGVMDVDDCVAGARYLADQGLVDGNRLLIRGGSAGGYTTLNALTFTDAFTAGASYFGIADLVPFVTDTHKFESRYLFRLVGPYPERADIYHDRSALNFTDQIAAPMIILQGLDDKVVPPNQAEMIVNGLKAKGLPHAYIAFPGEGHGFRKAENVQFAQEAELSFYGQVLGFDTPGVERLPIENLG
jgi:dipeptidyl aminopeptidase/acylaminoacyl peptidase